ncbi:DUF551 domain-containing protein [Atlantibacter hermannii]|uniref:DUF551 domain-containing protein n=1 Tax=Atlantibacter hermannii TaxID=565 RepID=UPI002FD8F182
MSAINERVSPKRLAEIIARAEVCDDSVLTDYRDIESIARELQQYRAAAACPAVWVRYGDANHAPDCTLDNDEAREWAARGLDVVRMVSPINAAPQGTSVPDDAFERALSVLNDTLDDCGDSERGLLLALDRMGIEVAGAAPAVQAEQLSGNTEQVEPVSDANKLGGWIPVSERIPARDVDVQVYCADKSEQMVGYMERNETDGWFRFASLPNGGGVYCKPTHWMPLPAAPKQEAE